MSKTDDSSKTDDDSKSDLNIESHLIIDKNERGIPQVVFIEDIDEFLSEFEGGYEVLIGAFHALLQLREREKLKKVCDHFLLIFSYFTISNTISTTIILLGSTSLWKNQRRDIKHNSNKRYMKERDDGNFDLISQFTIYHLINHIFL